MVFATYFFKRFIGFFFATTLLLAVIFNLIEFFEKLVRVEHTDVMSIMHFIGLNFLPSFSDLIPIGVWLATCLVVWEFHQQHEWETLFLLNIGYKELLKLFACGGLMVTVFAVILHENFVVPLSMQAAQFKLERFKQGPAGKIANKTYMLQEDLFCSIGYLDMSSFQGSDLLLVYLSPQFDMQKIITATSFYCNSLAQKLTIIRGNLLDQQNGQTRELGDEDVCIPSLFMRLKIAQEAPSFIALLRKMIVYKNSLPQEMRNELLSLILVRLLFYFQVFIYPILTFFLFVSADRHRYYKWILLLLSYPLIVFLGICTTFLLNYGVSMVMLAVIFCIFSIIMAMSAVVFWKKKLIVR